MASSLLHGSTVSSNSGFPHPHFHLTDSPQVFDRTCAVARGCADTIQGWIYSSSAETIIKEIRYTSSVYYSVFQYAVILNW